MKVWITAVSALFFVSSAFASATPTTPVLTVKINSFIRLGDSISTMAELCGSVTVSSAELPRVASLIPVTVTTDPDSGNPGSYTVLTDRVGGFCVLVNSYTGTAQAEAWLPGGVKGGVETSRLSSSHR